MRFSNEISEDDIIECEDIMTESQKNVEYTSDKEHREVKNDVTAIFGMMKDMFDYKAEGKKVI